MKCVCMCVRVVVFCSIGVREGKEYCKKRLECCAGVWVWVVDCACGVIGVVDLL